MLYISFLYSTLPTIVCIDEDSVAFVSDQQSVGEVEIHIIEVTPDKWFVTETLRPELGWEAVYDMHHATTKTNTSLLVLCSWKDESVAAVDLPDGKVLWIKKGVDYNMRLPASSVCVDELGKVYVACGRQQKVLILSVEDGSLLFQLSIEPSIGYIACIRFQEDQLYLSHKDAKIPDKWAISIYRLD